MFNKTAKKAGKFILLWTLFVLPFLFRAQIKELFPDSGLMIVGFPLYFAVMYGTGVFINGLLESKPFEDRSRLVWWILGVFGLMNALFTIGTVKGPVVVAMFVWFVLYLALPLMHSRLKKNAKRWIAPTLLIWTGAFVAVVAGYLFDAGSLAKLDGGLARFWGFGCGWLGGTVRQLGIAKKAMVEAKPPPPRKRGQVGELGNATFAYDIGDMISGGQIQAENW